MQILFAEIKIEVRIIFFKKQKFMKREYKEQLPTSQRLSEQTDRKFIYSIHELMQKYFLRGVLYVLLRGDVDLQNLKIEPTAVQTPEKLLHSNEPNNRKRQRGGTQS